MVKVEDKIKVKILNIVSPKTTCYCSYTKFHYNLNKDYSKGHKNFHMVAVKRSYLKI